MYERFTDRARKVMQLANKEAQRLYHEHIGTEHILLGLLKEGSGVAASTLKNLDIALAKIRQEVDKIVKAGPDKVTAGKLPQTPQVKRVIEYSIEEAHRLNHNYVGTEHLLLGLLREQEGVAAQVLRNLGLKLEDVREEVLNLLGDSGSSESSMRSVIPKPAEMDLSEFSPEIQKAVRELETEINKMCQAKQDAIALHDFEKAVILRDRADRLKKIVQSLIRLFLFQ